MAVEEKIRILDCTLRDGGRIIDCQFKDEDIAGITGALVKAKVDIIELGFLRNKIRYSGNSTFFTEISQLEKFMLNTRRHKPIYAAFTDYGMFDYDTLPICPAKDNLGIRIGFKKENIEEVLPIFKSVSQKGYKVFVQPVNALSYNEKEFADLVAKVNCSGAYSFGIVDTYGAMYPEDLQRYFNIVKNMLNEDIYVDFHSHNNYQLSFALFQEIIKFNNRKRGLIIDATLNGMGKCAGNLNTELAADYLIRREGMSYDWDVILDVIDEYIYPIKSQFQWGYSIPALMAGMLKSHPNNIIYLTEKFRMDTKDIKNIIGRIDERTRQRYDYDKIDQIYMDYFEHEVDDSVVISQFNQMLKGKKALVIIPGYSLRTYSDKIREVIAREKPVVINLNFCFWDAADAFVFYGNKKRYKQSRESCRECRVIISSNIEPCKSDDWQVDYSKCIASGKKYFDNSTFMLLNLLKRTEIEEIWLAGLDGYKMAGTTYYGRGDDNYARNMEISGHEMNGAIKMFLNEYRAYKRLFYITPSQFEERKEMEYDL